MVCTKTCKNVCIIGYIIAAIAALVCGYNYIVEPSKRIEIPRSIALAYIAGGLVTFGCAIQWMMSEHTVISPK